MRRLPKDRDGFFKPVVFYRQDLEVIAEELGGRVEYEAEGMAFDSIDEMKEHVGPKLRRVVIRVAPRGPYVKIANPGLNFVFAANDVIAEIHDLARKRRRWAFQHDATRFLFMFGLGAFAVLTATALSGRFLSTPVNIALLFATVAMWAHRLLPSGSIVYLYRRHEHETWWTKHEEHAYRALWAAGGGIIVGLIVYYFTKRP